MFNDDAGCVRDVDAYFNNACCYQDVYFTIAKIVHYASFCTFFYSGMDNAHLEFGEYFTGKELVHALCIFKQGFGGFFNQGVYEVSLVASLQLASDEIVDLLFVSHSCQMGFYRDSTFGHGTDRGYVHVSEGGQSQCSGNGGCGECEHVNFKAFLGQEYTLFYTEALLFVYNGQSEIVEFDIG